MWISHNDNSDLPQKFNINYKLNKNVALIYIIILILILWIIKKYYYKI